MKKHSDNRKRFILFAIILLATCLTPIYLLSQNNQWGQGGALKPAPRSVGEQQIIDAYRKVERAVVNVNTRIDEVDIFNRMPLEGGGSGFIVDKAKGFIVTNSHVINAATSISVTFANGESVRARVAGRDVGGDLALLQVDKIPNDASQVEFADSSSLVVGQRVLAIGNPFGYQRTLTTGIVSSLGRTIRAEDGRIIEDVIQVDAAINPGSSGGPLLDVLGRVIGVNTQIVSKGGDSAGIGFAIPVNQLKRDLPQLVTYGKVLRPKVGVITQDTEFGVMVLYVVPNSPADKAGLRGARRQVRRGNRVAVIVDFSQADFIVGINEQAVRNREDVLGQIGSVKTGEKVRMYIRRGLYKAQPRMVEVIPELG